MRMKAYVVAGFGILAAVTVAAAAWALMRPGGPLDMFKVAPRPLDDIGCRKRVAKLHADMRSICIAARCFHVELGRWPISIAEVASPQASEGRRLSTFLEKLPHDPWGNEYRLDVVKGVPRITCLGSDGVEGGEGEAADVVYTDDDEVAQ